MFLLLLFQFHAKRVLFTGSRHQHTLYSISALSWPYICICSWTWALSTPAVHSLAATVLWYRSSVNLDSGKLSFLIVSGQGELFYHSREMVLPLVCPGCFTEVAIPIAWENGAEPCADEPFEGCLLPHFHCWEKWWSVGPLCKVLLKKNNDVWDIFQRQQHPSKKGARVVLAKELLNSFSFVSLFSKPISLLCKLITMCWHCHSHHRLELAYWLSCSMHFFVPWEIWDLNTHLVYTSLFEIDQSEPLSMNYQ